MSPPEIPPKTAPDGKDGARGPVFWKIAGAGASFQAGSSAVDSATIVASLVNHLTGSIYAVGAASAVLRLGAVPVTPRGAKEIELKKAYGGARFGHEVAVVRHIMSRSGLVYRRFESQSGHIVSRLDGPLQTARPVRRLGPIRCLSWPDYSLLENK